MKNMFRNLFASEVEARVGRGNETHAPILLYKDARVDQNILDESVGPMNWQKRHSNGNANCVVSIWDKEKSQWVEKEDVGVCFGPDAKKGTASDSFKRACFVWGIGRELYTVKLEVEKSVLSGYRNDSDGVYCDNTFRVTTLECTEDHVVSKVVVDVLLNGEVIHTITYVAAGASSTMETKASKPTLVTPQQTPAPSGTTASEITEADIAVMYAKAEIAGSSEKGVKDWIEKQFKVTDVYQLTAGQYQTVCRKLDEQAQKKKSA